MFASRPLPITLTLALLWMLANPCGGQSPPPSEPAPVSAPGDEAAPSPAPPDIDAILAEMSPEERQLAEAARERYDEAKQTLQAVMVKLRVTHIRFVNQTDPPRRLRREFLETRWAATEALTEQLRAANGLLRYLPVPEAAQFMATEVERRVNTDWLDADTYEAASVLLQLQVQTLSLLHGAARSALVTGQFEMTQKLYDLLKPEYYEDVDRRLIGSLEPLQAMFEREEALLAKVADVELPRVRFETTRGPFTIELFTDTVPRTCAHFLALVEEGFYDDLDFGQVTDHLLALSGDPVGDGRGNAGRFVRDENPGAGHQPWRGAVVLAKLPTGEGRFLTHSASSQFAIPLLPLAGEGFDQAVIGQVIEGMGNISMLRRVDPSEEKKSKVVVPPDRILSATITRPPASPLPEPDYLTPQELAQTIRQALTVTP